MGIILKNNKQVTKNMTIKGDNGVGIKTITSGTPVVTEEKTTTPITVTLTDETTQNFNVEAKNGSGAGNVLTKPTTTPSATQIVAVDNTNTQTMLNIGDGLSVENGSLKASGGTGGKLYYKKIKIMFLNTSILQFSSIKEIDIDFYESNNNLYTIDNIKNLYTKIDYTICKTIQRTEAVTTKLIFGCTPSSSNFKFFGIESDGLDVVQLTENTLLFSQIDGTNVTLVCESKEV